MRADAVLFLSTSFTMVPAKIIVEIFSRQDDPLLDRLFLRCKDHTDVTFVINSFLNSIQ